MGSEELIKEARDCLRETRDATTREALDSLRVMLTDVAFELEAAESRSARYREALARLADAAKTQASITHPEADILTPILDEFADVLKTLESP